jgi:hypothetical protein
VRALGPVDIGSSESASAVAREVLLGNTPGEPLLKVMHADADVLNFEVRRRFDAMRTPTSAPIRPAEYNE